VRRPFAAAGWALLAGVLALDVYRAATQSVTHDEALTYLWYVDGPIERAFGPYMPNNHVLHTLLAWISVHALGLSELSLRLPSVLGGLLYLCGALTLSLRALGGRWISLLGFGLLALNPLVLDFLSAARGYSLAMGFWTWALIQVLAWFDELAESRARPPPRRLLRASLLVGLSVGGHLTFALPGAGLLLVTGALVLLQRDDPARADPQAGSKARALAALLLPAAAVAGALWLPPLLQAQPSRIDYGLPRLRDTSANLAEVSLAHHPTRWPLDTTGPVFRALSWLLSHVFVPLAIAWLVKQLVPAVRRALEARSAAALAAGERFLLLTGGPLLLALGVFVAAHYLIGALYPQDRWGLYLILLFILVAVGLAASLWAAGGRRRIVAGMALAVLWCVLLQDAAQLQARSYYVWGFDAGTKELFETVVARRAERPDRPVRVAANNWILVPSLNFYRALRAASWMPEVRSDWAEGDADYDFFFVRHGVHDAWTASHLRILRTDEAAGVSLAVPKAP
jgi:hypothetical protein